MTTDTSRRAYIRALGTAGLAAVSVSTAGCSAQSDGGDTPMATVEPTEQSGSNGGSGGGDVVQTDSVDMTDELTFEPANIEVPAGTTVTWENVGTIGHTVTAYEDRIPDGASYFASGGFDSEQAATDGYPTEGNIQEGETYEHTFETPGEYEYYCIPHELNGMVGSLRVT